MPASGFLFAQGVIFFMLVATLVIGGIARMFGRPATALMVSVAMVFATCLPFVFAWRPAEVPNHSDALLGWPLSYALAESDSGLAGFRFVPLLADLALGTVVGAMYLFVRRHHASQRIA